MAGLKTRLDAPANLITIPLLLVYGLVVQLWNTPYLW